MSGNNNQNYAYVAIVAIVAVVAIIVLISNGSSNYGKETVYKSTTAIQSEQNQAGNAMSVGSSCSSYKDMRSCMDAGCAWHTNRPRWAYCAPK